MKKHLFMIGIYLMVTILKVDDIWKDLYSSLNIFYYILYNSSVKFVGLISLITSTTFITFVIIYFHITHHLCLDNSHIHAEYLISSVDFCFEPLRF